MSHEAEFDVEYKGILYNVQLSYEVKCLRRGSYSCIAADPDEYFGIYEPEDIEVDAVMRLDPAEDEWVDAAGWPDAVTEEAIYLLQESL